MKTSLRVFARIAAGAMAAAASYAATDCDHVAALKNVDWAKTGPHSWFDNVQHKEEVEFNRTWCHIWETDGVDRLQKAVDFGRVLFTGDGWHPAFGGIVPPNLCAPAACRVRVKA